MWLRAGVAVAGIALAALPAVHAQAVNAIAADLPAAPQPHDAQAKAMRERLLSDRLPDKPSLPPAFTIPVEPLGFSAPSINYLGQRWCVASLDFLDENRLLFTFRVPGLMHRDPNDDGASGERQIRALVLLLPAGTVDAEALWTVHDRARYLWMLKDGHFLLRDRDSLREGDSTLVLKPTLEFPGPLLWLETDPGEQFLVTNSREPAAATPKPGQVASLASAEASVSADGEKTQGQQGKGQPDLVLRILRRDTGKVMLVSRVRSVVHLPINADGYLELLRGNGREWVLNLDYFEGGGSTLARVESDCAPNIDFVSQREVLVTACAMSGASNLVAVDTGGRRLWQVATSGALVWPLVKMSPDGLRIARETLAMNRPVGVFAPLDSEDVKGQVVRVLDAANGKLAFEAPASPALDGGGNMAISPSGRRVAVLNAGSIQVFELPAPAPLPGAEADQSAH
jgi:hypothetical protein